MTFNKYIAGLLLVCFSVFLGHNLVPHHHHSEVLHGPIATDCPFGHSDTPEDEQDASAAQDADEQSFFYTLHSENLEFYVEHQALVAGEKTEILVHLTRIDSYKACSEGAEVIRMDGVSVTSGKALSPGIPPGDVHSFVGKYQHGQ